MQPELLILHSVFRGENRPAQDIFNYLSYEYGPYMTVWLTGWKPAVILSSYEAIREAVIENLYDFASRPESPIFDFVLNGSLGIAFAPSNETWAAHKKMAGKAIRQIVDGKKLEEQTAAAVAIAANEMMKNGLKNPMPIAPYVKNTVYNVIFMFALGKMYVYLAVK